MISSYDYLISSALRHVTFCIQNDWCHKAVFVFGVYIEGILIYVLDPKTALVFVSLN